jgi:anti-sigma regulatory factor (Ser/Thr protein kinase)
VNDSDERFVVQVTGGKQAAALARRAVLERNGSLPRRVREDMLLLVSELVTNAVLHGGVGADRSLDLDLELSPRHVRVQVADPGNGSGTPALPSESPHVGGWGLRMVDQVADEWGVSAGGPGTRVWFEIRFAA